MKTLCRKLFAVAAILFSSFNAVANVDCTPAVVQNIQVNSGNVLVRLSGQNWHKVGNLDDPATSGRLALLMAAQASGNRVMIRYPAGYDCSAYETQTSSLAVRSYPD